MVHPDFPAAEEAGVNSNLQPPERSFEGASAEPRLFPRHDIERRHRTAGQEAGHVEPYLWGGDGVGARSAGGSSSGTGAAQRDGGACSTGDATGTVT